jgi:hypothetical protein
MDATATELLANLDRAITDCANRFQASADQLKRFVDIASAENDQLKTGITRAIERIDSLGTL